MTNSTIVAERLPVDDWADPVARLYDSEVPADPVADLVVTLQRKGVLTGREAMDLLGDYLLECDAAETVPGHNRAKPGEPAPAWSLVCNSRCT
ncbi:hypothetical protein I6F26_30260 [Ensifer sp. IC3342]|nr:hypothetical protein [Ensifer sp. BRP08]MCA1450798.1 hypothetical protein [Ensifer sp. IC3342]